MSCACGAAHGTAREEALRKVSGACERAGGLLAVIRGASAERHLNRAPVALPERHLRQAVRHNSAAGALAQLPPCVVTSTVPPLVPFASRHVGGGGWRDSERKEHFVCRWTTALALTSPRSDECATMGSACGRQRHAPCAGNRTLVAEHVVAMSAPKHTHAVLFFFHTFLCAALCAHRHPSGPSHLNWRP